jgi:hypothetical protein
MSWSKAAAPRINLQLFLTPDSLRDVGQKGSTLKVVDGQDTMQSSTNQDTAKGAFRVNAQRLGEWAISLLVDFK